MEDDHELPWWRVWLLNRFVLTPAVILGLALIWNAYVSLHNDGVVAGQVVDAQGEPVADADVALWVFNFTTFSENRHVKTGPDGRFAFDGNPSHHIQVQAQKPGQGSSERVPVRLLFRGENTALDRPLVLPGG